MDSKPSWAIPDVKKGELDFGDFSDCSGARPYDLQRVVDAVRTALAQST